MRITIVGCGNMGSAYARSFRKYGLVKAEDLCLVGRHGGTGPAPDVPGRRVPSCKDAVPGSDLVILAVKPQDFAGVADALAATLVPEQVVLSIMAGVTLENLKARLGHSTVVRAMPNAPAQIGMGITAYATATELTMRQTLMVEQLLNCTGRAMHLGDESLLDPVTALSGSGPAYFFEIVKIMIDSGIRLGLEPHVAGALVKQTMLGSFHLMEQADRSADELIASVMSKGGTTEAAFKVLRQRDLAGTLDAAVQAATERASELGR